MFLSFRVVVNISRAVRTEDGELYSQVEEGINNSDSLLSLRLSCCLHHTLALGWRGQRRSCSTSVDLTIFAIYRREEVG
jgi:hypothetical protein